MKPNPLLPRYIREGWPLFLAVLAALVLLDATGHWLGLAETGRTVLAIFGAVPLVAALCWLWDRITTSADPFSKRYRGD